jgi:FtsP/CotA-like multicopper oxidase with cupredoxin domain
MLLKSTAPSRRRFIGGAAAFTAAAVTRLRGSAYASELPPPADPAGSGAVALDLVAAERSIALPCFGGAKVPLWTLADGVWPPVVRLKLGQRLDATLANHLPRVGEHSSIHWHGIRLPNDQDGVPYLTQQPVWPVKNSSTASCRPTPGRSSFTRTATPPSSSGAAWPAC